MRSGKMENIGFLAVRSGLYVFFTSDESFEFRCVESFLGRFGASQVLDFWDGDRSIADSEHWRDERIGGLGRRSI